MMMWCRELASWYVGRCGDGVGGWCCCSGSCGGDGDALTVSVHKQSCNHATPPTTTAPPLPHEEGIRVVMPYVKSRVCINSH